ncbi:hypothetical protein LX32DRAFT_647349 [Colletotrichum zoysiae]|uniref:Uncharacterized protein n=1 Tax=Colletotrichum zoysiae TaxID=1216348 RepID=A0AAD9H183_9PEZI|nr:hypothetical protein LX32DRAFT_647349 [Colletotrichum zoysiae]
MAPIRPPPCSIGQQTHFPAVCRVGPWAPSFFDPRPTPPPPPPVSDRHTAKSRVF